MKLSFFAIFGSALLFGLGLGLAEMTLPAKVIGFLNVTGAWDPSLIFVMMGAIAVHSLSYRAITKRSSPLLAEKFHMPVQKDLDKNLILGSLIFGVGWGIGGFCPGPAIVASVSGHPSVLIFLVSMGLGIYLHHIVTSKVMSKSFFRRKETQHGS